VATRCVMSRVVCAVACHWVWVRRLGAAPEGVQGAGAGARSLDRAELG